MEARLAEPQLVIVPRRLRLPRGFAVNFEPMTDTAQQRAQLRALLAEREAELASTRAELTGAKLLIE